MNDYICVTCGNICPLHEQYSVDGTLICPNCAEWLTVNCSECGERILKTNNKGDNADPLCSTCWNRYII